MDLIWMRSPQIMMMSDYYCYFKIPFDLNNFFFVFALSSASSVLDCFGLKMKWKLIQSRFKNVSQGQNMTDKLNEKILRDDVDDLLRFVLDDVDNLHNDDAVPGISLQTRNDII
ncbi:CLUMA_CG019832, isoform A [Clunio marinus]|uniref:CLUMA_CG019832, isoform A n=1 Tax=Clunio marinus TaxID=568069 RepID=A0A1J1J5V4_9DIPT|nr:CLUMA_CG019832, isoform A [Clunio marinus]